MMTKYKPVLLLSSLIFLSRLLFALVVWKVGGISGFFSPDTATYIAPAQSLLHGSFSTFGVPEIFRTPGYPLLLAAGVALGHVVVFGILANCLLSALTAILIWKITEQLFPNSSAPLWATVLYAFEPLSAIYAMKLLSETLFCALFVLFLWFFVCDLESLKFKRVMLAAATLVAATYTRPASLFFPLFLLPVMLLFPKGISAKWRITVAATFCSIFLLGIAPWMIRNEHAAGYPGFSSASDYNLYFYSAAAVEANLHHEAFLRMQRDLGYNDKEQYFRLHPEQRNWPAGKVLKFENIEARHILEDNWATYLPLHIKGMAIVLLDPDATELLRLVRLYPENGGLLGRIFDQGVFRSILWFVHTYPIAIVILILLGIQLVSYYILAAVSISRTDLKIKGLFICTIVYFTAISGGAVAVARFRHPFMPLLCICAGIAIGQIKSRGIYAPPVPHYTSRSQSA